MSNREVVYQGPNIGLPGAVFIVFLVLKLTGVIDWSWWWVTSPLWIPFVILAAILLLVGLIAIPFKFAAHRRRKKAVAAMRLSSRRR